MSEKKAESWITDSLTGSASGTGYEKEEWINELFSSTLQEEIREILQNRFDGKFDFWNGSLQQNKPALWKEQYLLLSLFNGHYHLMRIPVLKNSFDWQVFRHYPEETAGFLQEKSIFAHVKWISENEIKVMCCIEDGGRGDEDGFGVEPDTWIVSALDKKGQFKYPFRLTR